MKRILLLSFVFVLGLKNLKADPVVPDAAMTLSEEKAAQLVEIFKRMEPLLPSLQRLMDENTISGDSLNFQLGIGELQSLSKFIQSLPTKDQLLIERVLLVQIEYTLKDSHTVRQIHEDVGYFQNIGRYAGPTVTFILTRLGYWSLRKIGQSAVKWWTKSGWFSGPESKKSLGFSLLVGAAIGAYVYYEVDKAFDKTVDALSSDEKRIQLIMEFLTQQKAELARKEALALSAE